jgi:hypothetical protein
VAPPDLLERVMRFQRSPALARAAGFLWSNARLLERVLFARRFHGASAEPVVAALLAYRNPDGGFGHALEPDVRAPESMPLHCEIALRALADAGVRDAGIAAGACAFLASLAEPSGRVPIVLPAVLDYPHASHWNAPIFAGDSPNPTAALVGLLRAQGAEHAWLDRAEAWCWERLEAPLGDAHEIAAALAFCAGVGDRARGARLAEPLAEQAAGARWYRGDPADPRYGLSPLQLCPSPDAPGRSAFGEALLAAHLDALAAAQQADGGWPISFEPPSPAAVLEWRGRWTLEALGALRAWGRL